MHTIKITKSPRAITEVDASNLMFTGFRRIMRDDEPCAYGSIGSTLYRIECEPPTNGEYLVKVYIEQELLASAYMDRFDN
jgi:hypothetical protein